MRLLHERLPTLLAVGFLLVAVSAPAEAWGQALDAEDLELLESLTPEQRSELLRTLGRAPAAEEGARSRDVSSPDVVLPREQQVSELEETLREAGHRFADELL